MLEVLSKYDVVVNNSSSMTYNQNKIVSFRQPPHIMTKSSRFQDELQILRACKASICFNSYRTLHSTPSIFWVHNFLQFAPKCLLQKVVFTVLDKRGPLLPWCSTGLPPQLWWSLDILPPPSFFSSILPNSISPNSEISYLFTLDFVHAWMWVCISFLKIPIMSQYSIYISWVYSWRGIRHKLTAGQPVELIWGLMEKHKVNILEEWIKNEFSTSGADMGAGDLVNADSLTLSSFALVYSYTRVKLKWNPSNKKWRKHFKTWRLKEKQ